MICKSHQLHSDNGSFSHKPCTITTPCSQCLHEISTLVEPHQREQLHTSLQNCGPQGLKAKKNWLLVPHRCPRFSPTGSEEIWSAQTAAALAATPSTPATFIPHSDSIGSAQQDSRADVRLQAHLHAPPATIIPEEDDDDLLDAPPEIDTPVSTAVSSALIHLERAIDGMDSASPTHPSFDPLFYLALSSLPLTYPWPILTIDLKGFLPLMDRHVLTHLVAAQASINPRFQHPAPALCNFFKDLAHTVVHTILAPLNSQFMRPNLPPRVFTAEFWHAHLNYAALRTNPALAAIGSMDGLAGDQICQWNSVAPDSILPATPILVRSTAPGRLCLG